jgi:hypothetical protein
VYVGHPVVVQQVKLTGAGAKTGRDATAMRPRCDLYLLTRLSLRVPGPGLSVASSIDPSGR